MKTPTQMMTKSARNEARRLSLRTNDQWLADAGFTAEEVAQMKAGFDASWKK